MKELPIVLFKCDIEGFEEEVFSGDSAWLRNIQNLVVECHRMAFIEELKSYITGVMNCRELKIKQKGEVAVVSFIGMTPVK